jgi:hypothetical protein
LAIIAFCELYRGINRVMGWGNIEQQLWSTKLAQG